MTTMLKSQGDLVTFFDRPIGGTIGKPLTIAVWTITHRIEGCVPPGDTVVIRLPKPGRAE